MRVQNAPGSVFKMPDQLGDAELREDWYRGLSFFNSYPPITFGFSFAQLQDIPDVLVDPIWLCAEFHSSQRLQWFEAGVHFQYSDNGIVLTRDRQAKFAAANQGTLNWISTTLKPTKMAYQMGTLTIAGQFSSVISFPRSLTRGLRGTRLGL